MTTSLDDLSDDQFAQRLRQAIALPEAPPALVHRAIGLWNLSGLAAPARPSLLRRIAAVLSFDSAAAPPLALGMRSAGGDTRHLLFSAQERDIDLRIAPAGGAYELCGQVLGPDAAGSVSLLPEGAPAAEPAGHEAALDELGEFRLAGIAPGRYLLSLRLGDDELMLPAIDVGGTTTA